MRAPFRSVVEIADGVRSGALSAATVLEESLATIDALNPVLNAFIALDAERARHEAAAIDRRVADGEDPGPLAGVPFGVKDLEDLAGFATRRGSLLHADDPPAANDSVVVGRLRQAGAIAIGKTATPEYGMDSATWSKLTGVTRNPWNPAKTPGGSSGGSSAAVAAGMVPIATATDGGGSTREPAAFTGLVGLKPSHGRIPQENGFSLMACKGALTRTVRDAARFLDIAAGPHDNDRTSLPAAGFVYENAIETLHVDGMRAVFSRDHGYAPVDSEVADIAERAADRLVEAAKLKRLARDFHPINPYPHWGAIAFVRMKKDFERTGILPGKRHLLSEQCLHYLDMLEGARIEDTSDAEKALTALTLQVADFFREADLLMTPATAIAPYAADAMIPSEIDGRDARMSGVEPFGMLANVCWNPSISIPAGLTSDGLPVGLQITARRHADHVLLRLARIMEIAHPWSFPARFDWERADARRHIG